MSGRNIIALLVAVVVGIVLFKILIGILSLTFALLGWLIYGAIAAAVIYALYRVVNNRLGSGKRLT
jgi:uncharacterized protein (DUF697 family)